MFDGGEFMIWKALGLIFLMKPYRMNVSGSKWWDFKSITLLAESVDHQ